MFIPNLATDMEIINGIIKATQITETITHHLPIEISNPEIILMALAFKIFNYKHVLVCSRDVVLYISVNILLF